MYGHQIGVEVGVELEVTGQTESGARMLIERSGGNLRNWQMHHDGSTLHSGYQVMGLPYTIAGYAVDHSGAGRLAAHVSSGAELVSPILDTSNDRYKAQIGYLCDWLITVGHERPGTYTSTHVHVSAAGLPLYTLKNLLRIWSFLEAPMFRLSCAEMGYHRGKVRKEYAYCRPLSAPLLVFDQNGTIRPSFSVPNLMKATNLNEFFLGYGATNPQSEPIRYHPARYCAMNLLPLLTIGTVEFRTFNQTNDPRTIQTWIDLSKAIVYAAFSTKGLADDDYPQLPLGYAGDFELGMMQTLLELTDAQMDGVARLWSMADWCEFDGIPLFNSNNENTALSWNDLTVSTVPPAITGQSVMMYAATGGGRNSEDMVHVFHDSRSYRSAINASPVPVEEGRALVLANFREETQENLGVEPPSAPRSEPRRERTIRWSPQPQPTFLGGMDAVRTANYTTNTATSSSTPPLNGSGEFLHIDWSGAERALDSFRTAEETLPPLEFDPIEEALDSDDYDRDADPDPDEEDDSDENNHDNDEEN